VAKPRPEKKRDEQKAAEQADAEDHATDARRDQGEEAEARDHGCHSTPPARPIARAVRRKSPAADGARLTAAVRAEHEVLLTCRIAARAFSRSRNSYGIDAEYDALVDARPRNRYLFPEIWPLGNLPTQEWPNGPTR
jgi:hypothetical protein